MALSLAVGVWVARVLGPSGWGDLLYGLAVVAFFGDLAGLGLEGLAVREMVARPADQGRILGTVMALRALGGVLAFTLLAGLCMVLPEGQGRFAVLMAGASLLVQPLEAVDTLWQARTTSKFTVFSHLPAVLGVNALRVFLVLNAAPWEAYAGAIALESLLAGLGMLVGMKVFLAPRLSFDPGLGRRLLRESWPVALSGLAIMGYMRLDQVMLNSLAGPGAVGAFGVAARLSEAWFVLPMVLVTSAFPLVLESRSLSRSAYHHKIQTLLDKLTGLALLVGLSTQFVADPLVALLYGRDFAGSGAILALHVWSGVFVAQGLVFNRWLVAEGKTRRGLLIAVAGGGLNAALNLWAIPRHGAIGSAWASVASYALVGSVAPVFWADSRELFALQLRAFLYPWRLLLRLVGR